jgi:NADH-quinone oxidoreductase subunit B
MNASESSALSRERARMQRLAEQQAASENILTSRINAVVNWCQKNSLWPMPMGLSCCAIEMMAMAASRYDLARFGAEAMRFTPRQCDLMIVAGTVTKKMAPAVERVYDQMPDPKWVISMGVCATSGGMFNVYSVLQGVDLAIPVDVYIPGCPPRPDNVIYAVMRIQEKIMKTGSPLREVFEREKRWPEEELRRDMDEQLERAAAAKNSMYFDRPEREYGKKAIL